MLSFCRRSDGAWLQQRLLRRHLVLGLVEAHQVADHRAGVVAAADARHDGARHRRARVVGRDQREAAVHLIFRMLPLRQLQIEAHDVRRVGELRVARRHVGRRLQGLRLRRRAGRRRGARICWSRRSARTRASPARWGRRCAWRGCALRRLTGLLLPREHARKLPSRIGLAVVEKVCDACHHVTPAACPGSPPGRSGSSGCRRLPSGRGRPG